jgi:hypothetical protein
MSEVISAVMAATILASGTATRYDPGAMDPVVANRIRWRQIDPHVEHKGYVALLDYEHLGRLVWLEHDGRIDGPYMVADCAAEKDRARLLVLGFAVDLSWELALDWGVVDDVGQGFTVYDADPRPAALPAGRVMQ